MVLRQYFWVLGLVAGMIVGIIVGLIVAAFTNDDFLGGSVVGALAIGIPVAIVASCWAERNPEKSPQSSAT